MSNRIVLSGRLGKDPEVFTPSNSDNTLLTLSMANNDNFKKEGDQYVERTVWVKVKFWTKKPQPWIQRLVKGVDVSIEGIFSGTEAWQSGDEIKSCGVFEVARGTFPKIIKEWNDVQQQEQQEQEDDLPPF